MPAANIRVQESDWQSARKLSRITAVASGLNRSRGQVRPFSSRFRRNRRKEDSMEAIDILLVEDNPGDVRLTQEALRDSKLHNHLSVVSDGVEALAFLRREGVYADAPRPGIILLDLNLPRKDGREVLREVKEDDDLKRIPVVVLTTSNDEQDILRSYN